MTIAKTFVVGKVRPTFNGAWQNTLTYSALDMVSYRGEAYMAVQDVPLNREPDVSADYWVKVGGKGDKGETGAAGPQGVAGRDGAPGIQGIRGEKGDQGIQGIQGPNGPNGAPGIQGPRGVGPKHRWLGTTLTFENPDGTWSEPADLKGPQGIQGPEGPIGQQGIEGPVGQQGPRGEAGPQGPVGPLPALSNAIDSTSTVIAASSAAVKMAYDKALASQITLSDAVNSNSSNVAATSRAVKIAYDKAVQAANAVPSLSNSIASTSPTIAASSAAVKTAYDAAVAARNAIPSIHDSLTSTSGAAAGSANAVRIAYETAVAARNAIPAVHDSLSSYSTMAAGSANALRIAYETTLGRAPMPSASYPSGVPDYAPVGAFGTLRGGSQMHLPLGGTWAYSIEIEENGFMIRRGTGIDAGGKSFGSFSGSVYVRGFVWRIA